MPPYLDTIRTQHQAAVRFGQQSELHAILAGKALLQRRPRMRPRARAEWLTKEIADTADGHQVHTGR